MKEHGNIDGAILLPEDWDFYQQYVGGFQDLYDYAIFCQHLDVHIYEELMEVMILRATLLIVHLINLLLLLLLNSRTIQEKNIRITPGTTCWTPLREAVKLLSVS